MDNQDDLKLFELQIKTEELAIKKREGENKSYEMWTTYLRETRSRADSLMRAALLVAGGALTLSVGAFLRVPPPSLESELIFNLKLAWFLLALSMAGVLSTSLITLASSYLHGKRWKVWLDRKQQDELKQPEIADILAWAIGLLTFVSLIAGLGLLTQVAIGGVIK